MGPSMSPLSQAAYSFPGSTPLDTGLVYDHRYGIDERVGVVLRAEARFTVTMTVQSDDGVDDGAQGDQQSPHSSALVETVR